jgi:plasmid replication initiation protein
MLKVECQQELFHFSAVGDLMEVNNTIVVEADNKLPKNAIVAKDHSLIEKMADFNLQELRLIAFCVAHLDSREGATNEKKITAKVKDLTHIFPMNEKSAYSVIDNAIRNIGKKPMEFNDGKKLYLWSWFSEITYEKGAGRFEFTFNSKIEPFLLGLKERLSMYRLYEVPFKSSLTWLLFENLNIYLFRRRWTVELDDLRKLLGVSGKYPRWVDFKKRCIDGPLLEINKNSNLDVKYSKVKTVRTVTAVTFHILSKSATVQEDKVIDIDNPIEYIYESLLSVGVKQGHADTILKMLAQSDKNIQIRERIDGIVKRSKGKSNRAGYVYKAVVTEIKQGNITDAIPSTEPAANPQLNSTPNADKVIASAKKCFDDKNGVCSIRDTGYTNTNMCGICFEIHLLQ